MYQWVLGPKSNSKACRINTQTMQLEIPIRVNGQRALETIDLKPFVQEYLKANPIPLDPLQSTN